jgi:phospholipid/cholesterol/gamma-HCH transport system substrate-binding protein
VTRKGIETLVGFFVLLGMAAMVFLALRAANLGSFNGGSTYTVTAKFQNIGGLKPRAPVRSAGVKVGSVTKIGLDPVTYEGVVTMQIQQDFKFPTDSAAKILTSGLLGDQYIGLEPGPAEQMVADGGRFTQTQSAVVLENLIGQFLANSAEKAGSGQ